jgi:hypothetical protein
VYLNSKPALRDVVVKAYDYALGVLRDLPDADYGAATAFARQQMPRWRILQLAREHSVWTHLSPA